MAHLGTGIVGFTHRENNTPPLAWKEARLAEGSKNPEFLLPLLLTPSFWLAKVEGSWFNRRARSWAKILWIIHVLREPAEPVATRACLGQAIGFV
jgi:hypothetical protein